MSLPANSWKTHLATCSNSETRCVKVVDPHRNHPCFLLLQIIWTTKQVDNQSYSKNKLYSTSVLSKTGHVKFQTLSNIGLWKLPNFLPIVETVLAISEHFRLPTCRKMYCRLLDYSTVPFWITVLSLCQNRYYALFGLPSKKRGNKS